MEHIWLQDYKKRQHISKLPDIFYWETQRTAVKGCLQTETTPITFSRYNCSLTLFAVRTVDLLSAVSSLQLCVIKTTANKGILRCWSNQTVSPEY